MMWRINPKGDRLDCLSLLDTRVDGSIRQLLRDPESRSLLVPTDRSDTIWSTDGTLLCSTFSPARLARQWSQHPRIAQQLILITIAQA